MVATALQVCSVPGLGCQWHPGVLPAALACLHWYADTRPDLDAAVHDWAILVHAKSHLNLSVAMLALQCERLSHMPRPPWALFEGVVTNVLKRTVSLCLLLAGTRELDFAQRFVYDVRRHTKSPNLCICR